MMTSMGVESRAAAAGADVDVAVTAPRARLTRIQWLICAVACVGFAFDTYEITVFAVVARPSLASFGLHPGSADYNRWVGLLLWVPQAAGGFSACSAAISPT